jgi:diguanylate cyclase
MSALPPQPPKTPKTAIAAHSAGHPTAAPGAPGAQLAGLPVGRGVALLVFGSSLLAAALAWLFWLLGGEVGQVGPGVAAFAAALGVLAVSLPLGAVLLRLVRQVPTLAETPAVIDPSTGAASRAVLTDLAAREWARARRYGTGAAVLVVEVDRYARLCEARGADAGEAVLRELARQTAPTLRGADVLSRFGGAQLAVFLVQADATGALDVAERIRERAEQLEVPWHPQRLRLTCSIGVAHLRPAHQSVQALLDDANDALQAARDAGGNCVRSAPVERRAGAAERGLPRDDQRTRPG